MKLHMKRTRSGRRYGGYGTSFAPHLFSALTNRGNSSRRIRQRVGLSRTNTFTRTQGRRKSTSGQGVTLQHDARMIYRKKSMPRRRRMRWKRFRNKVNAVAEKDLGSRTVVFNRSLGFNNETSGNQTVGSLTLYGQTSTESHHNDLNNISGMENSADPTAAAGVTVDPSTKILFQSAVLDITIKNSSGIGTVSGLAADYRGKMEIDVYELSVRKDVVDTTTPRVTFEQLLDQNSVTTKSIGGAGTEINQSLRGVTLWDCTYSLARYGIKVITKRKYFVSNQETITYQVRDPKRRVTTVKGISDESGFNKPGWTKIIYIVGKLVPGLPIGNPATPGNWREEVTVGVTRKYFYKVEGISEDRTRFVVA